MVYGMRVVNLSWLSGKFTEATVLPANRINPSYRRKLTHLGDAEIVRVIRDTAGALSVEHLTISFQSDPQGRATPPKMESEV
jgi:hypothetical protein